MEKLFLSTLFTMLLVCTTTSSSMAQQEFGPRISYRASLTYQIYGIPFQNIWKGFSNPGISVGVDLGLNSRRNLVQAFTLTYQSHQQHETSYSLNTQLYYRPLLFKRLEPSIGIGVGYQLSVANPKNPFYEMDGDRWKKAKQTKGHWQAPISLSLGYRIKTSKALITLFLGYDIVPIIGYNSAFVVLPYTRLNFGTRFSFLH